MHVPVLSSFFPSLPCQYESEELEKCVYQDYDSDSDVADELKQDFVDEQTGDVPNKRSVNQCHHPAKFGLISAYSVSSSASDASDWAC